MKNVFGVFQELDLSNNYLDNLPAGLFRDMSNLTKLTLHNNSLTVMDRELFQVLQITQHLARTLFVQILLCRVPSEIQRTYTKML